MSSSSSLIARRRHLLPRYRSAGCGCSTNSNYPAVICSALQDAYRVFMFALLSVFSPKLGEKESNLHHLVQSQVASPLAHPRMSLECPAGVEPASPGWKPGAFAARPRTQCLSQLPPSPFAAQQATAYRLPPRQSLGVGTCFLAIARRASVASERGGSRSLREILPRADFLLANRSASALAPSKLIARPLSRRLPSALP